MAAEVVLEGLTRTFTADHAAVSDVSLAVEKGEFIALIGPSGCGKSTTLRLIAGLDRPDRGTVTIAGKRMDGVAPQDRDVAMVFQGYALYPHMTVRKILEFPLRMRDVPKPERARAVEEAVAMLGLERLLDRRPDQLSGGERQRVAMGRAIVRRPRVFLFDEPLSNIDPSLRNDIRLEIGTLVRRLGATALYVTHDHAEAMMLADRIAVMRSGRVLQCAAPREVYERPATEFVGTFMGSPVMNVLDVRVREDGVAAGPSPRRPSLSLPNEVRVGVRAEDVRLGGDGVPGEVLAVEPLGAETHLVIGIGSWKIRARHAGFDTHPRGSTVNVSIDEDRIHWFDPARGGARVE